MITSHTRRKQPIKKILFQPKIDRQEISTVQNSQIWKKQLYDTFVFRDALTKGQIQVKDMKKERKSCKVFKNNGKYKTQVSKVNKSSNEYLNNCLKILFSTKLFQKESLKTKIFKQSSQNNKKLKTQQQKINQVLKQKKKLREIFTSQINKINMKEFHKFIQTDDYLVNPKIMSLTRNKPTSLTKQNIQKIIDISYDKRSQEQKKDLQKRRIQRAMLYSLYKTQDFKINGQDIFVDKMINRMHLKLKDKGQYLIKPQRVNIMRHTDKKRAITNQNLKESQSKRSIIQNMKIPNLRQNQQLDKVISSLEFKRHPQNSSVQQLKYQIQKKKNKISTLTIQQQKLIVFIKNKKYQQVRHMLFQNPQLYDIIDDKQNNLLHICAQNNSSQIFSLISKNSKGYKLLNQKNHLKRKPFDLVKTMGSQQLKERAIEAIEFHYN